MGPYYTGAEERYRREEEEEEEGALLYCSTVLLRRGLVDLCTTAVLISCRHVSCVTPVTMRSIRVTVDFLFFPSVRSLTNSLPSLPLWLNHVVKGMEMNLDLYNSSPMACAVWDCSWPLDLRPLRLLYCGDRP
jgi:hypothetical protein